MRNSQRNFWAAAAMAPVAVISAQSIASQPAPAPGGPLAEAANRDSYPGGDFTAALEKMFMGEGGEGGIGYRSADKALEVPTLTEAQLRYAVTGNTIRKNFIYAIHLNQSGTAEGWFRDWEAVKVDMCSKYTSKEGYHIDPAGECWKEKVTPVNGRWQLQGDKLCLPDVTERDGTDKCFRMAFFMNGVVLLNDNGVVQGKEMSLAKDKVLAVETV